jgi:hypothetical protein
MLRRAMSHVKHRSCLRLQELIIVCLQATRRDTPPGRTRRR